MPEYAIQGYLALEPIEYEAIIEGDNESQAIDEFVLEAYKFGVVENALEIEPSDVEVVSITELNDDTA